MSTPNPNPKTPILNQSAALMKLESSFLDFYSLTALSNTCVTFRQVNKKRLTDLREMASELLDHVLNIDENRKKRIIELLAQARAADILSIALIPVAIGREQYFSSQQNKIVCKREQNNLTPLEAAAICGDFHVLKLFRDFLPENQKQEAGLQLLVLRKRKDYMSLFFAAHHALKEFVTRALALEFMEHFEAGDTLCGQLGEAQKALSKFGRQVLCNPKPNSPLPDLTLEPRRSCLLYNDVELDLDSIGLSSFRALFKGLHGGSFVAGGGAHLKLGVRFAIEIDLKASDLLCKVIPREVDNITGELLNCAPDKLDSLSLPAARRTFPK